MGTGINTDLWTLVDRVLEHSPTVLLHGPPGTGKTYAANKTHRQPNQVHTVTLTEETPAAELRGHFVPKGGEFMWMDGPAVSAWRSGNRLVINEIDRGSGDCLTLLFAICDDPEFARLTLPTGETVTPSPGFQVVATTNANPDVLPEALQDRFPVQLEIRELAPGAIASLSPDLQNAAKGSVDVPAEKRVSTRRWKRFDALRKVMDEETAALAVFGFRASEVLNAIKIARGA